MTQELTLINPKEYGLEEKKGTELTVNLIPILAERDVLMTQYDELMKEDFSPELAKKARTLRLLVVKNRTQGTDKWHKVTKDYFLSGGRFVDAKKNMENAVNERMETSLLELEQRQDREEAEEAERILAIEKERLDKLQNKRVALISDYIEDAKERDLSSMDEDVWSAYLGTKIKEFEDRVEAERKAEEDRVKEEKSKQLHNERSTELIPYMSYVPKETPTDLSMVTDEQYIKLLDTVKVSKKDYEVEQERIKKENTRLKEEKESLENQIKVAQEKHERVLREEAERVQTELNKGDADKVKDLINELKSLKEKYSFKSAKNKKKLDGVKTLIDKVIDYIEK